MTIELLAAAFVGAAFASACTFAKSRRTAPSEEAKHSAFCAAMERRHG
jgi:hypothetical protein